MQCELCGKESNECKTAMVDNVRMILCSSCLKHGTNILATKSVSDKKPILNNIRRQRVKDVYKDMDKNLVSDWYVLIKNARKKKGLTREKLGFNIGERTVTIAKIENGDLRPSDKVINKLEKELGITLVEKVEKMSNLSTSSISGRGLTLGDFIKTDDK